MTLGQKLFGFHGRLRRRDWWLLTISFVGVRALCMDLSRLALFGPAYAMVAPGMVDWASVNREPRVQVLHAIFALLSLWPTAALACKRMHDRGRSAVPILCLAVFATIMNTVQVFVAYEPFSPLTGGLIGTILMIAIQLYMLVVLGFLDGTHGPNRFGPSPKDASDAG